MTSTKLVLDNCLLSLQNGKYRIATLTDLEIFQVMACGRSVDYVQTTDIAWNGAWNHMTTATNPFTGTYDGTGHSITGLQISVDDAGFVPFTQGASISNVSLAVNINGGYGSGGVARLAKSTTITNVRVSGTVAIAASNPSQGCLGGLVGETTNGTNIQKSSFTGTVAGPSSSWNGGLIGCAYEQSIVGKSYVDGSVSGGDEIGGLIGWMDQSDITDSYMVGSVTATGSKLGGLVGWLGADGSDAGDVAIRNSYASVQIQGVTNVGALVGEAHSTALESSHWEAGLTGVTGLNPIGLLSDQGGTQPSLAEATPATMKTHSFFDTAGWSIESGWSNPSTSPKTWGICESQTRPFLLWQHASSPCAPPSNPTPPSNDTTPPSSAPDTTTPSDSTTSTTAPPASATEKSSASTTTTSTTAAPTTETSSTTTSTTTPKPKISTGGITILSGRSKVNGSLTWSGSSSISGSIGNVDLSMKFSGATATVDVPARVTAGSIFVLALKGLKPGSKAIATMFSTPTTLGNFTAGTDGALRVSVKIPSNLPPGAHRLRLELVDLSGRELAVWLGVRVEAPGRQLPATGSPTDSTMGIALGMLALGIILGATKRVRSVVRMSSNQTG
jgi:hypothetical protein